MSADRRSEGADTSGLVIGVAVGVPAAVAIGAAMATVRSFFDTTNAALVLMIVVVAVSALGGRAAGIATALAAVVSFDFFHTQPYLSLAIDSRDDIETTALLLIAAGLVGTIASWGRSAYGRAGAASSDIRRIHRVAEAAVSGAEPAAVIAAAQDELRQLLVLQESRFVAGSALADPAHPRLGRNGAIVGVKDVRYGHDEGGRGGFELPVDGIELPVLARGQHIGCFVLRPTPGVATSLDQRLVAVAIADQVAAIWVPSHPATAEQRP